MKIDIWKKAYLIWGSDYVYWDDLYQLFLGVGEYASFWEDEHEMGDLGLIEFYNHYHEKTTRHDIHYIKLSEKIMEMEC